ncbi:hypothetical protein SFRURICE_005775 [Spodoptera frugiperda]|nr:hypothetical protein SFRURICE_005775 [Spodoptera frugiperda]
MDYLIDCNSSPPRYNSKLTTLALPSVIFEPKFRGSVRNLVYSDLPGQPPRRQELRHSRDLKIIIKYFAFFQQNHKHHNFQAIVILQG